MNDKVYILHDLDIDTITVYREYQSAIKELLKELIDHYDPEELDETTPCITELVDDLKELVNHNGIWDSYYIEEKHLH